MSRSLHAVLLSLAGALCLSPPLSFAADADQPADPIATRKALAALLASSNAVIPKTSTCRGDYGQDGQPTIKDLLSMQLAYLYAGQNAIEGQCASGSCSITISHAGGEDLSSATIEFRIRKGSANPATLHCVITP